MRVATIESTVTMRTNRAYSAVFSRSLASKNSRAEKVGSIRSPGTCVRHRYHAAASQPRTTRAIVATAHLGSPLRAAVISDIHGNLYALEAVLDALEKDPPDEIWSLGDTIGYGPRPNRCAALMQERAG